MTGLDAKAMNAEIEELQYKNSRQAAQLKDMEVVIELQDFLIRTQEDIIDEHVLKPTTVPEYAGEFEITYYCPCAKCCGKTDGITASGTLAIEGQTVSADWDLFPPGTQIYINGIGYRVVEDKGGAIKGNRLDVYMDSHEAALEAGRHMADVWIVEVQNGD